MKKTLALLLLVCASLFALERRPGQPSAAPAPPPPTPATETAAKSPARPPPRETPPDQISTTQHTVTVHGQLINYTARAVTMVLKDEDSTPKANFFFVSYTRD